MQKRVKFGSQKSKIAWASGELSRDLNAAARAVPNAGRRRQFEESEKNNDFKISKNAPKQSSRAIDKRNECSNQNCE